MGTLISCGVPHLKFPKPFLEEFQEKMRKHTKQTLPLCSSSKKGGVYFGHGIPVDEINATLYFLFCVSVPPWLIFIWIISHFAFNVLPNV